VFFDHAGIPWVYEPEGFDLGDNVLYLPDFYLPELDGGTWLEIKGMRSPGLTQQEVDGELGSAWEADRDKIGLLAKKIGRPTYLFMGYDIFQQHLDVAELSQYGEGGEMFCPLGWDNGQFFCECSIHKTIGIQYSAGAERNRCCRKNGHSPQISLRLQSALTKAMTHRFYTRESRE